MRKLLIIFAMVSLTACHATKREETKRPVRPESPEAGSKYERVAAYAEEALYPENSRSGAMTLTLNGQNLTVLEGGKVNRDGKMWFDMKTHKQIEKLYMIDMNKDIVAFFVENSNDNAASFARKINPATNKIIWSTPIYGFNLSQPLIVGNKAYLSTIGFVGKLNLDTGRFEWKFENLYSEGKYNSFSAPEFSETGIIVFKSYDGLTNRTNVIKIDDVKGKIVSKD